MTNKQVFAFLDRQATNKQCTIEATSNEQTVIVCGNMRLKEYKATINNTTTTNRQTYQHIFTQCICCVCSPLKFKLPSPHVVFVIHATP
jgi:hypothetical protein